MFSVAEIRVTVEKHASNLCEFMSVRIVKIVLFFAFAYVRIISPRNQRQLIKQINLIFVKLHFAVTHRNSKVVAFKWCVR